MIEQQLVDGIDGRGDGLGHGGDSPIPSSTSAGFAADDEHVVEVAPEIGDHGQHGAGIHAVGIHGGQGALTLGLRRARRASMTDTVPGGSPRDTASTRTRMSYPSRQLVGQVDPADPEVGDLDPGGDRVVMRRRATSTPKPSSPEKDVAHPCHQDPARPSDAGLTAVGEDLDLVGMEVQVAAVPLVELRVRVIVDTTASCTSPSTSWNTPATVAARPATNRSWASAPCGWVEPHPGAVAHASPADADGVGPRVE